MSPVMEIEPVKDVVFVTAAWGAMYYLMMQMGPAPRLAGGYSDKQIRMGERAFGNLHEQSIMFLVSLWMHALFVDVSTAASLGWAWLAFRLSYVVIWALTAGDIMPGILLSTMPMYGIVIWLFATTIAKAEGFDIKALVMDSDAVGSFAGMIAFFVCFNIQQIICQPLIKALCFGAKAKKM